MLVVLVCGKLRGARICFDFHNLGYTMLALKLGLFCEAPELRPERLPDVLARFFAFDSSSLLTSTVTEWP